MAKPVIENILSHKNSLTIGLSDKRFYTFVDAPLHHPESPFREAVSVAGLIAERAGLERVKLLLSGGVDSECMFLAFHEAQVKFDCVVMRFEDGLNSHDISAAEELCQKYGREIEYIDIDIIEFFTSEKFMSYALQSKANTPKRAAYCWLIEQVKGVPVFGGDYIYFHNNYTNWSSPPNNICLPDYYAYCLDRKLQIDNRFGVCNFNMYTPEFIHSFFWHTRARDYQKYDCTKMKDVYDFKLQIYREGGFQIGNYSQRTCKFSGFEKVITKLAEMYQNTNVYEEHYLKKIHEFMPTRFVSQLVMQQNMYSQDTINVAQAISREEN